MTELKEQLIDNKCHLRQIMKEEKLDTLGVADLLKRSMHREFSVRTIQAWAADESKKSSRPCPDWVIENLRSELRRKHSRRSVAG